MKHLTRLIVVLSLFVSATASAASFDHNDHLVLSVPVRDDLYVAGGSVNVDAPVTGDLFLAGGQVSVGALVDGDLFAAGGDVRVNGRVSKDARLGGGTVIVSNNIGEDLLVAGGQITIDKNVRVQGDLVVSGGNVVVHGAVTGDVRVYAGNVLIDGPIGGDVEMMGGNVEFGSVVTGNVVISAERLSVASTASIGKDLRYWSEGGETKFPRVRGKTTFDSALAHYGNDDAVMGIVALMGMWMLYSILSGAAVVLLFVLISKRFFADAAGYLRSSPGVAFVSGALYFLLLPVLGVLLCVTVIGIPLGIVAFASLGMTLLLATPLTALTFAKLLEHRGGKHWGKPSLFGVSIILLIVLKLLCIVPFVGWLVKIVAIAFAVGALLMAKYHAYKKIL